MVYKKQIRTMGRAALNRDHHQARFSHGENPGKECSSNTAVPTPPD